MKKYHLFLFLLILFLVPNVYASDYKLNSHISATNGGTTNRYGGLENYTYGSYGTYTFGTRYQGRLGNIETYIDYPFEANTTYTLTYIINALNCCILISHCMRAVPPITRTKMIDKIIRIHIISQSICLTSQHVSMVAPSLGQASVGVCSRLFLVVGILVMKTSLSL